MVSKVKKVKKRNGEVVDYNIDKIKIATYKAGASLPSKVIITSDVFDEIENELNSKGEVVSVPEIQLVVEEVLGRHLPEVSKAYKEYRELRDLQRIKAKSDMFKDTMDGIANIDNEEILKENANMAGQTPAGQMMKVASEYSKEYAMKYLLNPIHAKAHQDGLIHIHDLDYYMTKTQTCLQYNLDKLYKDGFSTNHTFIREPQRIESYATLACIVFQTCQNEFHGGQAIPAFDFFMAPGVKKSFLENVRDLVKFELTSDEKSKLINLDINKYNLDEMINELGKQVNDLGIDNLNLVESAYFKTKKQTEEAMENFIYNMNTMHSRGGNQIVFSSINYGTDTSPEGRMVIESILNATMKGLGHGETPIFPIQIFKMKDGISYSKDAIEKYLSTGEFDKSVPNIDLFVLACKVSAKRLFPNFMNLDVEFNKHEKWQANDPKKWMYEPATMGCRTRVFENVNGEKTSISRGNLSFTTMNLVRLAIESHKDAEVFLNKVRETAVMIAEQLLDRFRYQSTAKGCQFPFAFGNGMWINGEKVGKMQNVGDVENVLNQGTLGIGFFGGYEAMVELTGQGHDKSAYALGVLHKAVDIIGEVAEEYKTRYHLNYSVLATPAEGLSGRFTKIDRKKYGIIPGVTDRDYYTNSYHVAVYENISAKDKVDVEAPFHSKCLGGHISYIELDGYAKHNIPAFIRLVSYMHDKGMGYFSLNHPVDRCRSCGYEGLINSGEPCPNCGSNDVEHLRRITGYLVGSTECWNNGKRHEEIDRVKHKVAGHLNTKGDANASR